MLLSFFPHPPVKVLLFTAPHHHHPPHHHPPPPPSSSSLLLLSTTIPCRWVPPPPGCTPLPGCPLAGGPCRWVLLPRAVPPCRVAPLPVGPPPPGCTPLPGCPLAGGSSSSGLFSASIYCAIGVGRDSPLFHIHIVILNVFEQKRHYKNMFFLLLFCQCRFCSKCKQLLGDSEKTDCPGRPRLHNICWPSRLSKP